MRDRAAATIDRKTVEKIVEDMLDGLTAGNPAKMVAHMAPDVVYTGDGGGKYPFRDRREGKDACAELMRAITIAYECLGSTVHRLLVDGDRASLHRVSRLRNRGSGRSYDISICNFMRFRDGMIVEFSQYPDTAALAKLNGDD